MNNQQGYLQFILQQELSINFKKFIYRFIAMTTPCEVIIYSNNKIKSDEIANKILIEVKRLENKYNYFNENSIISKINKRIEIELDNETKSILQRAKLYYKSTNGIFDITIATIKDLYRNSQNIENLNKEKENLLKFIGVEHFKINKNKIKFDNNFTKIDLGGFVKEYAVDRTVNILKKHKIKSALINYGGDIYALGKKPNGDKFKIGIKDPKNKNTNKYLVEIENEALTTSASYERSTKIENKEYSHIINKNENDNNIISASVISKTCVESGVFSTSLMIDSSINTNLKKYLIT